MKKQEKEKVTVTKFHESLLKTVNIETVKVVKVDIIKRSFVVVFQIEENFYYLRDIDYVNSVLSKSKRIDKQVDLLLFKKCSKEKLV